MSSFTNPIILSFSPLVPTGCSILVYGFTFYVKWDDETDYVEVPALMTTDGLSMPKALMFLFRKYDSRTIKAALVHDYLYKFRVVKSTVNPAHVCTRKEADVIFYKAISIGCRSSNGLRRFLWKSRCLLAYWALRVFGRLAWNRYR